MSRDHIKDGVTVKLLYLAAALFLALPGTTKAADLGCISTTFNLLSPNDKVCVSDFDDPKVPGVTTLIADKCLHGAIACALRSSSGLPPHDASDIPVGLL